MRRYCIPGARIAGDELRLLPGRRTMNDQFDRDQAYTPCAIEDLATDACLLASEVEDDFDRLWWVSLAIDLKHHVRHALANGEPIADEVRLMAIQIGWSADFAAGLERIAK